MKRLFPILMVAVMLLTGCGGASSNKAASDTAYSSTTSFSDFSQNADMNTGWISTETDIMDDAGMEESAPSLEAPEAQNGQPANTKIIYSADLELETKEFDTASLALDQAVERLGGYYESRSLNQGGSYRRLTCTIRVPAEHFSDLLTQAGELAHMSFCNEYTDDVSEVYYDNEARLTTQRTKLERLHKLLEQAATMEDIISLETAISDTELQIEYLTGTLRKYDSLIGYSTVNVTLMEVYRLSTDEEVPVTFGQRLRNALSTGLNRGIDDMEDFIISLARNWLSLLLLVVLAAVVILLLRRVSRRRRGKLLSRFSRKSTPDTASENDSTTNE